MSQNDVSQSDCRILESATSNEKKINQLDFWHADKASRNMKDDM